MKPNAWGSAAVPEPRNMKELMQEALDKRINDEARAEGNLAPLPWVHSTFSLTSSPAHPVPPPRHPLL